VGITARQGGRKQPAPATRSGGPSGLAARELAHRLITAVLVHRRPLELALVDAGTHRRLAELDARDRAFARALASTVLRRQGELEHVLNAFLQRPLPPDSSAWPILLAGAAQIVCLGTPPHAAVDLAVEATRRLRGGAKLAGLANAVLRRVAEKGPELLRDVDPITANIPAWLLQRWEAAYGRDVALAVGRASLREAALDISLKAPTDASAWAERLGGRQLPTGSVRCIAPGRIEELPGYAEGAWWVQDAAAALVTRAAGDVAGRTVADLCAAPGGKTAALAAAGAKVTAVDISPKRLERLTANLQRLQLEAEIVTADAAKWMPDRSFDAVVLDAPCTATGTIRRHPDILRLRQPEDVGRMAGIQRALIDGAARLVAPGGLLIYATCSLEPEEGERQIAAFLGGTADFARLPIDPGPLGADPSWITAAGEVRTLPHHLPLQPPEISGLDGFYVARLQRRA
jgi:16S rRNA (cytosine967-C5)-methyltransferase